MQETLPEYPALTFLGKTPDNKVAFMIGTSKREYANDDIGYDLLKYTMYRLNRLIRYKREKIALDNIK